MNNRREQTVWQVLEAAAAANFEKDLLVVDGVRYTYQNVLEQSKRLADSFVELGLKPGDLICLWLPNSLEWVVSFFAAARIGAIPVGINTRLRLEELAYLISHSQAKALVVSHLPAGVDFIELTYQLLPELSSGETSFRSSRFPNLQRVIFTGSMRQPGMLLWSELVGPRPAARVPSFQPAPDDIALVQYTSGTTGQPKGAMLTHGAITRNGFGTGERMGLNREDRLFAPNPFFHVAGTVTGLLNVVTHGATLVTMAHYEAGAALKLLDREECTAHLGLDIIYQREMEHPDFPGRKLALRKGICMGASHIFRQACSRMGMTDTISVYALSEASPNVSTTLPTDSIEIRASTAGKPQPGVEVRIAHPESNRPVAPGQVGEILVRGWNVMKGYFKDPAATAKVIDQEGWLHTGDLGRFDGLSNLIFAGRLKDVIRVGGENVSAEEVENFLLKHPAVKLAQVVAVADRELGEVPVAFVELRPDTVSTEEQLFSFCRGRLARFKLPRTFYLITEWPTTGTGKIQKSILRERASALWHP